MDECVAPFAMVGILIMMWFAPMIAETAFKFGPAEYFAMMLLGLVAVWGASSKLTKPCVWGT